MGNVQLTKASLKFFKTFRFAKKLFCTR